MEDLTNDSTPIELKSVQSTSAIGRKASQSINNFF